ncbi:MAG: RAD55 family ATPase [Methanomicrobiales archaeon]
MPTGIESLDPVFDGGVPAGSVILLLSDIGAGGAEFAYSSLFFLSDMIHEGGHAGGEIAPPGSIAYITITRVEEDVVRDISLSFKPALSSSIQDVVTFHDLSDLYFENSVVPAEWYSGGDTLSRFQTRGRKRASILAELSAALSRSDPGSLIIIDSLTDLAPQFADRKNWNEFISFLRGLQRVSKEWGSTVYLHLTSRILPSERETEVADCADALIAFRWEDAGAGRRQRVMYFEKFRGVMPHLEENDLVKFAVRISSAGGFEVSNIRVVI